MENCRADAVTAPAQRNARKTTSATCISPDATVPAAAPGRVCACWATDLPQIA